MIHDTLGVKPGGSKFEYAVLAFMLRPLSIASFRRMIRALVLSTVLVVAPFMVAAAYAGAGGPSFDCAKASSPDEKVICADPLLSRMDRLINAAYPDFEPAFEDSVKVEIARALVADRKACGADRPCVAAAMYNALTTYGLAPAWVESYVQALLGFKASEQAAGVGPDIDQPVPEKVGQCAVTIISALTTRFGEPLGGEVEAGAGSAVEFTNGGFQVDYGANDQLLASQSGQRAVMCLMAVPRDCPKGDDRGKLFFTLNTFTQGTWVLTDTSHSCGGA
jgi:uncharacterized protein